jgi:hypothetical protein
MNASVARIQLGPLNASHHHRRTAITALRTVAAALAFVAAGCGSTEGDEEAVGLDAQAGSASSRITLSFSPASVTAGQPVTVTIRGPSGMNVDLGLPRKVLAGPRIVRVGSRGGATIVLWTNPYLAAVTNALVTASIHSPYSSFGSASLTVSPASPAPATARPDVASLTFSPATVPTGTPSTATLTLTGPAPEGGAAVLVSNAGDVLGAVAEVPWVVVVPGGATSAQFGVPTHLPAGFTWQALPITASYFGGPVQGSYLTVVR